MISKVKRYFFMIMFGILYLMFVVQLLVSAREAVKYGFNSSMFGMSILAFEWLALMAARFLLKKSGGNGSGNDARNNGYFNRNHR